MVQQQAALLKPESLVAEFKKNGVTMVPVELFMRNLKEGAGVVRNTRREKSRITQALKAVSA